MPESTSVNRPQIKSELASLGKPELVALLKDLLDHSIESRAFLSARFLVEGVPDAILDKYRKRIVEQFFPKRGNGKLDLRSARRTIRDYRKATSDLAGMVDLMLTYVESGTEFTNQFGDINESFYNSLESVLDEMVDLLKTPEGAALYPRFQDRVSRLERMAGDIGWGYGDHVAEQIELLEAEVGKHWERWSDEDQVSARFARGMSRPPHRMAHHTPGKPSAASHPILPRPNR